MLYYLPLFGLGCLHPPEEVIEKHKDHTSSIGLISIKTNGVVVDEMVWERPWVDVEIGITESATEQTTTLTDPLLWSGTGAIHVRGNSSAEYEKNNTR